MPTVNDLEIDFDAMTNEELEAYLAELREVSKSRKPRAGASIKVGSAKSPKEPKQRKPKPNIIRIDL